MKENTTPIIHLHNLLDNDSKQFIIAEVQLKNKLHEWISRAESFPLKTVLQKYLDFVEHHIQLLEAFVEKEDIRSLRTSNRVMAAFIEEADEKSLLCEDAAIRDASLLASIQAINHYKISMYGTAAAFAKALDMEIWANAFHEAEVNEKKIDDRLSQLAEHEVNLRAIATLLLKRGGDVVAG